MTAKMVLYGTVAAGTYELVPIGPVPPIDPPDPPIPPIEPPAGVIPLDWLKPYGAQPFPFMCEQVAIWSFVVPAWTQPSESPARFSFSEFQAPAVSRELVLSLVAGSFEDADRVGPPSKGTSVGLTMYVGQGSGIYGLIPGTRYYINLRNRKFDPPPPEQSCPTGSAATGAANWQPSNP